MAYDLLRVGPEREVPSLKPAWMRWAVLSVVMVGGGAFHVVRFWPAGEPTGTLWFWSCVVALPFAAWAIAFLIYLGVLQTARQRVIDFNAAREEYLAQVVRDGGVPLHVLASGFVFSTDATENSAHAITQRQRVLEPLPRFEGDSESVPARWIKPDGQAWRPGNDRADEERHREVLPYVLSTLIDQVASTLHGLPDRTPVKVRLCAATLLGKLEVESCWRRAVASRQLGALDNTDIGTVAPDIVEVDQWVEGRGIATDAVTLLCIVQLNAVLNAQPPEGSSEAGVIFLIAPASFATKRRLASQVRLFRPERRSVRDIGQGLRQALLWSGVQNADIADQWLTGRADGALNKALMHHLTEQSVGVMETKNFAGQHDIDLRIGAAGIASGWLCVSLALEHAVASGKAQLCTVASAEHLTIAVAVPRP